ncbi:hypothetical protein BEP19_09510 [Ammoniphilus oxalaticus]|uniref:DUF2642 domain-containing protein n=1 Tax=Ammoniphilus oxalaticus TaxID=66863 RepID=A0A419SKS3_9BACL|nr:hypothetical protein [Ammoniphilus oxalaticus]RKD24604.1 hypothetical protein BEP19_09510 [Ammoniphilus oxalaticus]
MRNQCKEKGKSYSKELDKRYPELKCYIYWQRKQLERAFEREIRRERQRLLWYFGRMLRYQTYDLENRMYDLENRLRKQARRELQNELYSARYAEWLKEVLQAERGQGDFKEIAQRFLNEDVEVLTHAGALYGTITDVEDGYLVLRETESTIVIVPFGNVTSIRPQ